MKAKWAMGLGAAAALALAVGCVGGNKGLSSEDKDKLKPYILDSEPADLAHKLDINFENKVHIVGYKVEPEIAKPGTDLKITFYWRCDDTLDDGWNLFTHISDEVAGKLDNIDWVGPLRENRDNKDLLGPSRWEKGKFYVDEQTYKVPDWVKGPELTFMIGVWKGNARLRVVAGANDGDNRAIVAKVKTGLTPPPPPEQHTEIPEVTVNKLAQNEVIVIDGKTNEPAWGGAPLLGPFVDVGTGAQNTVFPVNGKARLLYDDKNLYVAFDVQDTDVLGGWDDKDKKKDEWTTSGQPKLWTKEAVEIMLDPDGDGDAKDYYELQISPQNKQFHSQYDTERTPLTEPNGPFGHEDWDPKMKSAVVVSGTLDKSDDKDVGYAVEAAIPWAAFGKAKSHPPKPGESWRMNFYAMKQNGGVAWSAILGQGSFHHASRFGRVSFGPLPGSAPAAASGSAAPPPAASASVPAFRLPGRPPVPTP